MLALDAMLAVAVALLGWYAAVASPTPPGTGWHEPAGVSAVAGVLLGVPVVLRRPRPVIAAGAALVVAAACLATGLIPDYAAAAPTVAVGFVLYTVGAGVGRRWSVLIALAGVIVVTAALVFAGADPFGVVLVAWVIAACWTVGRAIRERRAFAARGAEQSTALAVGEERLRIARELHDIVAHSLSVIAVKATIADHVADVQPQETREALRVIASISRESLGELRRALGALRTETVTEPAPGLSDLDGLAAAGRSAGLAVALEVRGRHDLPDGVGLAVFRIVQEALTNVVRHAGATDCRIDVEVGSDDNVRIRVTDNGSGGRRAVAEAGTPGQGLIGMRERVALSGGDFTAGPAPEGGWIVEATLGCAL
jgi:signal transduction histidine kinase